MADKKDISFFINENSPTTFSDGFKLALDTKKTMVLLQFLSVTPDAVFENHRTKLTVDSIKKLIDSLCEAITYYPDPDKKSEKKDKVKKEVLPEK